jgi:hypothetical protein
MKWNTNSNRNNVHSSLFLDVVFQHEGSDFILLFRGTNEG